LASIAIVKEEGRAFTNKADRAVSTFADQAVIALENRAAVRGSKLRAPRICANRWQQQTATADV